MQSALLNELATRRVGSSPPHRRGPALNALALKSRDSSASSGCASFPSSTLHSVSRRGDFFGKVFFNEFQFGPGYRLANSLKMRSGGMKMVAVG